MPISNWLRKLGQSLDFPSVKGYGVPLSRTVNPRGWQVNSIRAVAASVGVALAVGVAFGTTSWAEEPVPAATPSVQDNMDVALEYTLTVDGQVVDTTEGREAFHYIQGQKQVIPGLEKQLSGHHIGDSMDITITPDEGYGEIDPSAVVDLPKSQLPQDITPEVGMVLRGVSKEGIGFQARIKEIKDENVVLDLNHPLAGKTLNFKIKVTGISPASPTAALPETAPPIPVAQ